MFEFFNSLPGKWSFNRSVVNHINPELSLSISGVSDFIQITSCELRYEESCEFKALNGHIIKSTNSYFFVYNKNEQKLEKYFALNNSKSRLFYQIKSDNTASHTCALDDYQARYTIKSISEFNLIYAVLGPRKNYLSETCYTKIFA